MVMMMMMMEITMTRRRRRMLNILTEKTTAEVRIFKSSWTSYSNFFCTAQCFHFECFFCSVIGLRKKEFY